MTKLPATGREETDRTVQSYEESAREYDALVDAERPPHIKNALQRLVQCLPPGVFPDSVRSLFVLLLFVLQRSNRFSQRPRLVCRFLGYT